MIANLVLLKRNASTRLSLVRVSIKGNFGTKMNATSTKKPHRKEMGDG